MSEYEYSALTVSCDSCNKRNTIAGSIPEFEIVNCSGCGKPLGLTFSTPRPCDAGFPAEIEDT